MRMFGAENLVPLDLKQERTLRQIRKYKKKVAEFEHKPMYNLEGFREEEDVQLRNGKNVNLDNPPMVNVTKALRDYALSNMGIQSMIRKPAIQANNFEIKPITLQPLSIS